MGWHDPRAVARADGHDSMRGVDKLITIMKVRWNDVPCGVVVREGNDLRAGISEPIKKWAIGKWTIANRLPLLRHILSSYRKCASQETNNLNL